MRQQMAAKTTDHRGRIINVNRSLKELPPLPDDRVQVTSVTQGQTIKMEKPPETIAAKLNQIDKEKFRGQIICGYHDSDDEDEGEEEL